MNQFEILPIVYRGKSGKVCTKDFTENFEYLGYKLISQKFPKTMTDAEAKQFNISECSRCYNQVISRNPFEKIILCLSCGIRAIAQHKNIKKIELSQEELTELSTKLEMSIDNINKIFQIRPSLYNNFVKVKPQTTISRSTVQVGNLFISNKIEPLFQIGHWCKPNTCQDWADLTWADNYLKSINHCEDPNVYVVWYGTENFMESRFLVRILKTETNEVVIGIDACYGDSKNISEMISFVEKRFSGYKLVFIEKLQDDKPKATNFYSVNFSVMPGYSDIGKWENNSDFSCSYRILK